jgi:DNA/RNA endonuclease YhcR with UshA esterase domain
VDLVEATMRTPCLAFAGSLALLLLGPSSGGPESPPVIAPEDAVKYVGKVVTVEGTVVQVSASGRGTTFVNFGAAFPNQVFNAVVFKSARSQFIKDPASWSGKRVRVTGTVRLYQTKPEIVLSVPGQIEIVEQK